MPLAPPADRAPLHHRSIEFHGYQRADGLFDIECTLVDTKGVDVPLLGTGRVVRAGDPMHRMAIRMQVTAGLEVVGIEAASDATPYDACPEATASLQSVVGLKIVAGWTEMVKRRLGGARDPWPGAPPAAQSMRVKVIGTRTTSRSSQYKGSSALRL